MTNLDNGQSNRIWEFDRFRLDVTERLLLRDSKPIQVTPKVFDTLLLLVENAGRLVSKNELMNRIWPDSFVEEGALTRNISDLRKALGESTLECKFIETVPKHGYRFVAHVQAINRIQAESSSPPLVPSHEDDPPDSDSEKKSRKLSLFLAMTILLTVGLLGYPFFPRIANKSRRGAPASIKINRVTTTSNVFETAISPDGKFVAHVLGEFGQQSLWIKHLASADSSQLIPFAEVRYRGVTFSPDGNHIYFARREKNQSELTLYQIPLLGGTPTKVINGVDSAISFSPNGKQITFVRENPVKGESKLIIANADGSEERVLTSHLSPLFYSVDGPSWSPDGKLIACALGNLAGDFHFRIMLTQVSTGKEDPLGMQKWGWAMRVYWLADASGLVMIGRDKASGVNNQVWQLNYPDGEAQKIVTDLNDYRCLSLTNDSKKLVTIQSEARSDLWIVPVENPNQATQITDHAVSQNGYEGLDWMPDNKIVYTSMVNDQKNLWLINSDGSIPKQFTPTMARNLEHPSVSGNDEYVVFTADTSGARNLWRVDIDGKNPREITDGILDLKPDCSPDGQWITYSSEKTGVRTIWKISKLGSEGGQPVQLTNKLSEFPVISPDSRLVACLYQEENNSPRKIALLSLDTGTPIRYLDIPVFTRPTVQWHPDGQSLSFLDPKDDSSNIWLWPLSGKLPTKLTNFKTDKIFAYAWSRDGRHLACARGKIARDVVMITDFK